MKICYFGIYGPTAPRDKVFLDALRGRGIEVVECVDSSRGFLKYVRLWRKHRALKNSYDILWAGYLSGFCVPLAKIISRKRIVFNALSAMYENYVLDRAIYKKWSPRAWLLWCADFWAFHSADAILLESDSQIDFVAKHFFVRKSKLFRIWTGADSKIFFPDQSVPKAETFTVLFRGFFVPATGAEFAVETARLLKNENINFLLIGWGQNLPKIEKMIKDYDLPKVKLQTEFLPPDELRRTMLSCQVMLGQFGENERLNRTIQHKTFEALALGMPFITRDSRSNREILSDGENCLFVPPANPKAIAEKILLLRGNLALRAKLSQNARKLFEEKFSEDVLSEQIISAIGQL